MNDRERSIWLLVGVPSFIVLSRFASPTDAAVWMQLFIVPLLLRLAYLSWTRKIEL